MGLEAQDSDTLLASEARLRTATIAVLALCCLVDVALLATSAGRMRPLAWLAQALLCLAPLVSNFFCLRRNGFTIGMMPLALFSLGPAAATGLKTCESTTPAWWACMALALGSGALLAFFCLWFVRMRRAWSDSKDVEPDAVLIVLGGLVIAGRPVPTVCNRLRVAGRLWRESPTRHIVVTGGPVPDGTTTEAAAMANWLAENEGVPASALLLENEALNTEQNLTRSLALVRAQGLESRQVCVVSSSYHLLRAQVLARRHGVELVGIPAPVPPASAPQQWCREVLVLVAKGIR